MTLERLHNDMVAAWKGGDINRKKVLSDTIAHIKRAAIDKSCRDNIKEDFVDAELLKVQKMFKEMVDTCPDNEKYAEKKAEYLMKLAIAAEYAPTVIDDIEEIKKMIYLWGCGNCVSIVSQNKGIIMKMIMPWLKENHCDMKAAQEALKQAMADGDAAVQRALEG
jgi:uncharacterized protein YqeY